MAAKRKLEPASIEPVNVSNTCWLYGEAKGLIVVQEERDNAGRHIRTLTSTIPWAKVDEARNLKSN